MIDSPNKAYWLGFLWADGYIAKRDRETWGKYGARGANRLEYNLKFSLKESDKGHLQKFVNDLQSNYPIHKYKTTGFNGMGNSYESRVFITNKHMCGDLLYEKLGLIPNRHDPTAIINHIPKEFYRYFILGLFDGDGSFSEYSGLKYGDKMNVTFGGSQELLEFVEDCLIEQGVVEKVNTPSGRRKLYQRHEGKDGTWRSLCFTGIPQSSKILNFLYKDAVIYLDRKYQKYLDLSFVREEKLTAHKPK